MKILKRIFAVAICAGLAGVIAGGGVFYARQNTSYRQKQIEPQKTQRLSAFTEIEKREEIRLCAHRGLSATTPENTLEAIRKAGEAEYPYVLLNVGKTRDNVPVLLFDETLDRMTTGRGRLSFRTAQELRKIRIDNGANVEKYNTLYIPTLAEALDICREHGIIPVLSVRTTSDYMAAKPVLETADTAYVLLSDKEDVLEGAQGKQLRAIWYHVDAVTQQSVENAKQKEWTLLFEVGDLRNSDSVLKTAGTQVSLAGICVNTRSQVERLSSLGVKIMVTDSILPIREK